MKIYRYGEKVVANARAIWTDAMYEAGMANENVMALTGDLSRSLCTERFRKEIPERYLNIGIAEQNMTSIAAGLALCGKIPYCSSYAPFVTLRAAEQFRTDVCYMNLKVRIIGAGAGINSSGPTHSGLEDAGTVRGFANSTIVAPSDPSMISKIFAASVDYDGPMYIRLDNGRGMQSVYKEDYPFTIGKAIQVLEGHDVAIFSFGSLLTYAVEAALKLAEEGISVAVYDFHTLKPLDIDCVLSVSDKCKHIITLEDHNILNGLGSAVSEVLAENPCGCRLKRLGVPDVFPCTGPPEALHDALGYGIQNIVDTAKLMLKA